MIYTGYFDQIEEYKRKGLIPVSIAGRSPDWYDGIEYRKLAPKLSWWQKWHDEHLSNAWYTKQYYKTVLDKLSAKDVFEDLKKFGENVVLLCYEKPEEFCHRHVVATWFKQNKINVEEYKIEKGKANG